MQAESQRAALHDLHVQTHRGNPEHEHDRTSAMPGLRGSQILMAVGTNETLTSAEFVGYLNVRAAGTRYPDAVDVEENEDHAPHLFLDS